MRSLHAVFASLPVLLVTAGVASAQFGLCGAPELVKIPKPQQPLLPQYTYGNQLGYDNYRPVTVQYHYYQAPGACPRNVAYEPPAANVVQPPPVAYAYPGVAYASASQPAPPRPDEIMPVEPGMSPIRTNTISKMLQETRSAAPARSECDDALDSCNPSCSPSCTCDNYFAPGIEDCTDGCGNDRCCCPWYAAANFLMMGRNQANGIWTTYETADMTNQMMKSDFGLKWQPGGEIRIGRRFCCDCWALEFTYWTLSPFEGVASASIPGATVSTTLEVTEVEFAGGGVPVNAAAIFHNSAEQKLWRYDEVHNFDINLLRGGFCNNGCWPWDTQWCMGFKYFRFRDRLIYGAVANHNTWGQDGGIHEAYVNDHIRNNLFAFQFGFETKTPRRRNVQLFLSPKIAIGCNHIENKYEIYRGDGLVGRPTAASGMPGSFPVTSVDDEFSLVTQIDVGLDWQFAPKWSARIGYRLMVATGMGLADNQIPFYIVDIPEVANIDSNAELILHGGFAGITYNF